KENERQHDGDHDRSERRRRRGLAGLEHLPEQNREHHVVRAVEHERDREFAHADDKQQNKSSRQRRQHQRNENAPLHGQPARTENDGGFYKLVVDLRKSGARNRRGGGKGVAIGDNEIPHCSIEPDRQRKKKQHHAEARDPRRDSARDYREKVRRPP